MKLIDVSVLLAAHREDHPHFDVGRTWLKDTVDRRVPFAVVDLVAGAFLRIATNRRIFSVPIPLAGAFDFLTALRAQPSHALLTPGPRHLELLRRLCEESDAAGDLVADAQLAAIAVEHACEVVSFDRDFARFTSVAWHRPGERR